MPTRTLPFFIVTFGITWLLQLPAVLAKLGVIAGPPERYFLAAALGGFGPVLAAVLVARFERHGRGARSVFRGLRTWRVHPGWYLVAFGGFAAIYVSGVSVYRLLGGNEAVRWFYPPENAQHVAALIVVPFTEEPGWRGFALPRLQRRYGRLAASLLLGVIWALWHTMMFVLQGAAGSTFLISMLTVVAGSVIFSWIYNHTRQSLLLAFLAHAGVHLCNPFHDLSGALTPLVIYMVAIGVVALSLVLADRKAWQSSARADGDA